MTNRRTFIAGLCLSPIAAPFLGLRARPAAAGPAAVFAEQGVAIRGADAVAYFRQAAYVPGRSDIGLRWHGAVWLFSSLENRDAFEMNPRGLAPRFGGYCAYTLAQGGLVDSDPQAFALHGDGVYLMHDLAKRDLWLQDAALMIDLATRNWQTLRSAG